MQFDLTVSDVVTSFLLRDQNIVTITILHLLS